MAYTPAAEQSATLDVWGDSYVDLGNDIGIDFTNGSSFTVEGWFKFNGLCPDGVIFEKPQQFVFGTRGRKVYAQFAGQPIALRTDDLLSTSRRFHLAVTFDGQTLSIYVNGLQRESASFPFTPPKPNTEPARLAEGLQASCRYLRLWSTAQTQLYQGEWEYYGEGTENLQAAYAFYEYPARDVSGHNRPFHCVNQAYSKVTAPAVLLSQSAYCQPLDDETVNPGGGGSDDYTILAWVRLDTLRGEQAILCNGEIDKPGGVVLYVSQGTIKARRGDAEGAIVAASKPIEAETWYSIGYTYRFDKSAGTGTQKLYVNGEEAGSGPAGSIVPLESGSIVIGAANDSASGHARMNLQGYVQFISVWDAALSQTEIVDWMRHDPTTEPRCAANYNFASAVANNLVNGHSVALVRGAQLTILETTPPETEDVVYTSCTQIDASEPQRPFSTHRMVRGTPSQGGSFSPQSLTQELEQQWLDELKRSLPATLSPEARQTWIANFAEQASGVLLQGSAAPFDITHEIIDGDHVLKYITPTSMEEIFRASVADVDPCTAWKIRLTVTTLIGAYSVFAPVVKAGPVTNWVGERINTIGFWPQADALFSAGISCGTFVKFLSLLYEFGWLTTIGKLIFLSLTWWDALTIGARILMIIAPVPGLQTTYFLTKIVASVASVVKVWNERPAGC